MPEGKILSVFKVSPMCKAELRKINCAVLPVSAGNMVEIHHYVYLTLSKTL